MLPRLETPNVGATEATDSGIEASVLDKEMQSSRETPIADALKATDSGVEVGVLDVLTRECLLTFECPNVDA
jgi:hypothetical protein